MTRRKRLFLLLAVLSAALGVVAAESPPQKAVWHLPLRDVVHPVAADYLERRLEEADRAGAEAVVIELDTPGGLGASMHEITTDMLATRTPVVVYVSPRGAQAASAGFFLLMASDVAAMAPDTVTGAAAAVGSEGQDLPETLGKKIEQDSLARIRGLAEARGRNATLAEEAISKARSFTAKEALEAKLIELLADDFDALLRDLDGRRIEKRPGEVRVLATREAPVHRVPMTTFERLLSILVNPTIAFLLLSLGGTALVVELYNPGAILPGVLGAIFLVLAFYGLSVMPVNATGVALIALALLFFIAEIKVTSFGLLSVAGVVCLVLGGLMLIETEEPALKVSRWAIGSLSLIVLASVAVLSIAVYTSHRRQVATGKEGLIGQIGTARGALSPRGKVFIQGEIWNAEAEDPVGEGESVEVVDVRDLKLRVRRTTASTF
ncbi:MAG TPA: nodulation protein NfeD [Thermoanaerobaculia bacterium]|nr:nodulation protein NfeD [Thermoanaerobaculia bacterium]